MTMVGEISTARPSTVEPNATVLEAAEAMRSRDIGDVLVVDDGELVGILTDRDIVVRVIAEGKDPSKTKVSSVCTPDPLAIVPGESTDAAIQLMTEHAIVRLPVVREDGSLVGIVSLGDLAQREDPDSALAGIAKAPPNE